MTLRSFRDQMEAERRAKRQSRCRHPLWSPIRPNGGAVCHECGKWYGRAELEAILGPGAAAPRS